MRKSLKLQREDEEESLVVWERGQVGKGDISKMVNDVYSVTGCVFYIL